MTTQTERDLAESLRITAGQVTRVREHLRTRIADLEERRNRQTADAAACMVQGLLLAAAVHLREAADVDASRTELRRVLELLS